MPRRAGFSLLELSIVLSIIGLLVGGILATQSYLRNAELTTVVNEGKYYLNAMKQFERTYQGLPGDLGNASSYWASAANGDGNNIISVAGITSEYFTAFDHMVRAGVITGSYSAAAGSAGAQDGDIGVNIPALAMKNVGLFVRSANAGGYFNADTRHYDGFYGTFVGIGMDGGGNTLPLNGFMTPRQANKIDTKFDNGHPGTGSLRTYWNVSNCVNNAGTNSDPIGDTFQITDTRDACALVMTYQ
jgi:prepilin-type N-terminal cleavage/methylation domain-containing protein